MIDLDLLLTNLADPTGQAFAAICFGVIAGIYAVLTVIDCYLASQEDTNE